jgi:hypothetical protein
MAADTPIEFQKISATTTSGSTPATFAGGIQECTITADAAVFICFDQPAVASAEGILLPANTPFRFVLKGANVQKVYAVTSSSTANVYLMGVR